MDSNINCYSSRGDVGSKTPGLKVGMTEKELINLMGDAYFVSISSNAGKVEKILGWQNKESPVESTNLIRVKISSDGKVTDFNGKCDSHVIKPYSMQ